MHMQIQLNEYQFKHHSLNTIYLSVLFHSFIICIEVRQVRI